MQLKVLLLPIARGTSSWSIHRLARCLGITAEELEGRKIEVLIPPSARKIHISHREAFYQDPKNRKMGHNRDLMAGRKDGTTFPVEVSLSTYVQNEERYVIAFVIDITQPERD